MVRVFVVAKAPAPGRSKTRLAPPLTLDQASAIQTALLLAAARLGPCGL
jgi:glycosyltransferase A (GT-A) superfamily protein (DUF2064 family)